MWHDIKILNATANSLLGMLVLVLLMSGMWWGIHRPMFTLKVIRIEGVSRALVNGTDKGTDKVALRHVNRLTVRDVALPKIKGNFFTTNLDAVRIAFEAVPWVRKASVQREWPNKLTITLEEHQVLGTWGTEGRLISAKGDVFTANLAEAEEDTDLIGLVGPEGSEKEVLARYLDFKQWFSSISLVPEEVQYSSRYAWSVKLNNGMTVELGRVQDELSLKKRVDRLLTVYPQLVASLQDNIDRIDMRYPNGLALKASHSALGLKSKLK
jgi:cell division protein FtsQ